MPQPTSQLILSFVPDALSASQVGVWDTDFDNDRTRGDATLAAIFGVDAAAAADGLPLAAYVGNVLLEDRTTLDEKLQHVRNHGGMFVIEYRTRPSPNDIRWVLARGRYERDPTTGSMTGRGIVIDITDSKLCGQADDRAFFTAPDGDHPSLDNVAALALEARKEIDRLGERDGSPLRQAVDALLWAIGRTIASAYHGVKRRGRNMN